MDTKSKLNREYARMKRVLNLFLLVNAYHHYTLLELHTNILKSDNSYKDAESMSGMINSLFNRETKPSDFIHDNQEVANEALDNYESLQMWLSSAEENNITPQSVIAFCKAVEYGEKVIWLKTLGHLYYPEYLRNLILYMTGAISRNDLMERFIEYSVFTQTTHKASFVHFRKSLLKIEELYNAIDSKQKSRSKTKQQK